MYSLLLGALSGTLALFSLPPFELTYLVWFFPIPLFHTYFRERSLFPALLGWGVTFYTFSLLSLPMDSFFLLLLSSLIQLSLFAFILIKFVKVRFTPSFYVLFPTAWALFEFLQDGGFLGLPFHFLRHFSTPWLSIGVSLYSHPFSRIASLLGVWGISFLILAIGGLLHRLLLSKKVISFGIIVSILISLSFLPKPVYQEGGNIKVGLVQPCIDKEQANLLTAALSRNVRLSALLFFQQSLDLVIWPLSQFSFSITEGSIAEYISNFAKEYHCYIVVGFDGEKFQVYSLDGELIGTIGSFYNFPHWEELFAPQGEPYTPKRKVVKTEKFAFAILRDIEVGHPSLFLDLTRERAEFIIALGAEGLSPLFKANAVMRSLETGLYVVISNNTGPSLLISPNGGIKEIPPFLQSTLFGGVSKTRLTFPFLRLRGYWMLILASLFFIDYLLKLRYSRSYPL